jgi:hypothetical protein
VWSAKNNLAKYHGLGTRRKERRKGKKKKKRERKEGGGASGTEVGYSNFIMTNVPKFK